MTSDVYWAVYTSTRISLLFCWAAKKKKQNIKPRVSVVWLVEIRNSNCYGLNTGQIHIIMLIWVKGTTEK